MEAKALSESESIADAEDIEMVEEQTPSSADEDERLGEPGVELEIDALSGDELAQDSNESLNIQPKKYSKTNE